MDGTERLDIALRIGRGLRLVTLRPHGSKDCHAVADWSRAEIGYTASVPQAAAFRVADWSRAEIGYTAVKSACRHRCVADWSRAEIGYTCRRLRTMLVLVADWSRAEIGYTRLVRRLAR